MKGAIRFQKKIFLIYELIAEPCVEDKPRYC